MQHRRKKILLINNESGISGAEMSMLTLLNHLSPDKYAITILLPGQGALYDRLKESYTVKLYPFLKMQKKGSLFFFIRKMAAFIITALRFAVYARAEKADIIYANSIQAQIYCLFTFKKNIWHVRDRSPGYWVSKLCALTSCRIICVSRFIYDQVPAPTGKKAVIYNGLDPEYWAPLPKAEGPPNGHSQENILLVGMIGQLIPWKRHEDIILAAAGVIAIRKDVRFQLFGEDLPHENSGYIQWLKDLIAEKKLEPYFTFPGFKKNIKPYIDRLDILVHCAEGEPLGRVILESMALGKPVIACDSGGCREIITDGVNGLLVEPRNIEMLTASLLTLLADGQLRTEFGKQARMRIIEGFSLAENVRKVEEILDTL